MKSKKTKIAPKKDPVSKKDPVTKSTFKMTTTNQVILAAILVLLIFVAAVLSSVPKKNQSQSQQAVTANPANTATERRTGTQVASISITRGDTQQDLTQAGVGLPPGDLARLQQGMTATGNLNLSSNAEPGAVVSAGNRVQFKISTFKKLALQPLKFKVFDERGMELTPDWLQTIQEHKMHFYVVSANLREFQHLFPDYTNGEWNVNANLPNPGTYYAFVDISPVKGNPVVLRSELTVQNPTKGSVNYPGVTPDNLAIINGVSTAMTVKGIGLGAENVLAFSLTSGGKNVSTSAPYVGAFGNVVLMRQNDLNLFLKTRALPVADQAQGMFDFAATFMKAGRYTAFAEFKVNGKVSVFTITFEI